MRFDNAYLTTSSCSPTRCSIITGRYPHNTGAPELHVRLPKEQIRFPELLREAGYYTVLSGKNHMFGNKDRAFDRITGGGGPGKEKDWVDHVKDRPKDKPFFFWFASTDAHRSWTISDEAPKYDPKDVIIPPYMVDTEITRQDLAGYYHEVSRFDHYVGLVTAELKKQGVLENTMIVVAADNGRPFPRCKSRMYDSGIKTPWVIHYPKLIQKSSVTPSFVSVIDLSATCLELAGVKLPPSFKGEASCPYSRIRRPKCVKSFLPSITGTFTRTTSGWSALAIIFISATTSPTNRIYATNRTTTTPPGPSSGRPMPQARPTRASNRSSPTPAPLRNSSKSTTTPIN